MPESCPCCSTARSASRTDCPSRHSRHRQYPRPLAIFPLHRSGGEGRENRRVAAAQDACDMPVGCGRSCLVLNRQMPACADRAWCSVPHRSSGAGRSRSFSGTAAASVGIWALTVADASAAGSTGSVLGVQETYGLAVDSWRLRWKTDMKAPSVGRHGGQPQGGCRRFPVTSDSTPITSENPRSRK